MDFKLRAYQGLKSEESERGYVFDSLVVEHPLSIYVNKKIFSITMQTPGEEYELALGLIFTEGVYKGKEFPQWHIKSKNKWDFIDEFHLLFPPAEINEASLTKRNLLSSSSCGICGVIELPMPEGDVEDDQEFTADQILLAVETMSKNQNAFLMSGGCHGAAAFDKDLSMIVLKEDIGRHNAVDKVAGSLWLSESMDKARIMTLSGRVSFEIIYKCFAMGIPNLAAVSSPSSLAVDYAKELGIKLYGFCRENRVTRYA
jgi:FdhD protein